LTTVPVPGTPKPLDHPVHVRVVENLSRSRLTVFFRIPLTIPHVVWLLLWTIVVIVAGLVAGIIVFIRARLPEPLHRFFTSYIRYAAHVYAFANVAANPFPGFAGAPGYEIDVEFDPPARQNRWKTAFRIVLALPAVLLASVLGGSSVLGVWSYGMPWAGVLTSAAVLVWWCALFTGRAPEGLSRLQWYCLHYGAQASAYMLLVTDRYPTTDPERIGVPWPAPAHPIRLTHDPDDGHRSRLTVFFRLLLAIPHFVWLGLWAVVANVVALLNWFATLFAGRSPDAFHRFLAAFLRYQTHVGAYVALLANPFPGFTGRPGSYPVDLQIAGRERQNRWKTGFRLLLAFPAFLVNVSLTYALWLAAVFGWWASLFTGRMPDGLRKLGLFALRYSGQTSAYAILLLTDEYPYAGPPADGVGAGEREPGLPPAPDARTPERPGTPGFAPDDPRGDWVDSPFRAEQQD
jgi:hypothetical protein